MLFSVALLAVLQLPSGTSAPPDAYLDSTAAALVAGARARNVSANERIEAYRMLTRQRLSMGLRGLRRDRMLYTRELASRIDWRRGGELRAEVLGSRQASEVVGRGVEPVLGGELRSVAVDMAFDPTSEWLLRLPGNSEEDPATTGADSASTAPSDEVEDRSGLIHPLAPGSESSYRFRTGGRTTIRLGDGRTIELIELQVLPRFSTPNLVRGSLWLEADSFAAVRGVFSLASPLRFSLAGGRGSLALRVSGIGGILDLGSAELDYLTIEYGLWEDEWWLPRILALEGRVAVGRFEIPMIFEQRFEDYRVVGDPAEVPPFEPIDTTRFEVAERGCGGPPTETADSTQRSARADVPEDCPSRLVLIPRDTASLLHNDVFSAPLTAGTRLVSETELAEALDLVAASARGALLLRQPSLEWRPLDGALLRYNRVEGLTLGTSLTADLHPLSLKTAGWVGTAGPSAGFQVDLSRARYGGNERVSVYRRVDAFTPDDFPFSLGSSLSAFAFGHDDGDYYQALGGSLTSSHAAVGPFRLLVRGYVERQTALEKETDVSLRGWFGDHEFRPNPAADHAEQVGVELLARVEHGSDATSLRAGLDVRVRAERGTFAFTQPSAAAYATFPLPGELLAGVDVAGGTSFGDLPVQRLWYLGGPSTVRGFRPEDRVAGESFWRARAEVGTDFPGARLVLFSDAGWAGPADRATLDPALISAGVGASFLDGLLRADLARTLRGGAPRWGFQIYLDAIF